MKIGFCFLFVSIVLVFSGCSSSAPVSSTEVMEKSAEADTAYLVKTVAEDDNQEVGLTASYNDQVMEILDGSINGDTLTVRIRFTNSSSNGLYAYESFACIAYQDGTELEEVTDINDNKLGAALTRRVKDGASIEGEYKYTISGDGDIEFFICSPTAEEDVLAKKVFSSSASVSSTGVIEENAEVNTDKTVSPDEEADQEIGLIASYDDQVMEILDGSINGDTLTVRIRFTNNSSDGFYALESFACMAYQDGIELEEVTDINDDEMGAALIRGVKNGVSIEGEYKFTISGDSDIEFFICTPTAEEKILAKKVFTQ